MAYTIPIQMKIVTTTTKQRRVESTKIDHYSEVLPGWLLNVAKNL